MTWSYDQYWWDTDLVCVLVGGEARVEVVFVGPDGGSQTLRIQTREDGVSIDQIVLSSARYEPTRPGAAKNDTTHLNRSGPYLMPPQR